MIKKLHFYSVIFLHSYNIIYKGIRLPKEVLKSAGITLNEFLDVTVSDGVITLVKSFRHKTLEERAAEFDGKLMLDGEYDWGEPVGREVW